MYILTQYLYTYHPYKAAKVLFYVTLTLGYLLFNYFIYYWDRNAHDNKGIFKVKFVSVCKFLHVNDASHDKESVNMIIIYHLVFS